MSMIDKLVDLYWAAYRWIREHILRRPPLYAGRPVEISIRSEKGDWIELGTVESYDLHIDMTGDERIELPGTIEYHGRLIVDDDGTLNMFIDGDPEVSDVKA